MNVILISIGKLVSFISKKLNKGSGFTWPGHIALTLNRNFIKQTLQNSTLKIVLIAGTNGKTTTSKLLHFILQKQGLRVFHNESGANLLNGISSSIIKYSNFFGKIDYDVAIFEVDENTLPLVLEQINPAAIILLNLFRDQLDRYGEVTTITDKWLRALRLLPHDTNIIINGDDPQLYYIGTKLKCVISYFGVSDSLMTKKEIPHDVDSVYCPNCKTKLTYKRLSFSHLGDFSCSKCGLQRKNVETFDAISAHYPLKGTYTIYNTNAAFLLAEKVFSIKRTELAKELYQFKPAFGRQEEIEYKGKKIKLLLSKNPTSFNQSLKLVAEQKGKYLLLVLNDRIPDGRDISWIWDVDFEEYTGREINIAISGDRAYDMGLRMKYASRNQNSKIKNQNGKSKFKIYESLEEAVIETIQSLKSDQTLYILPTYSAMLEVRKILTGKKIL